MFEIYICPRCNEIYKCPRFYSSDYAIQTEKWHVEYHPFFEIHHIFL